MPDVLVTKMTILRHTKTEYMRFKHTDQFMMRIPKGYEWVVLPHERMDDWCFVRMVKKNKSLKELAQAVLEKNMASYD